MEKICKEKNRMSQMNKFKFKILIITLTVAVIAGFGTITYAASGNTGTLLQDERGLFDPFTLDTIMVSVSTEGTSDAAVASVVTRPPIRIPIRPVLRSFFRPPLVSVAP